MCSVSAWSNDSSLALSVKEMQIRCLGRSEEFGGKMGDEDLSTGMAVPKSASHRYELLS